MKKMIIFVVAILIGLGTMSQSKNTKQRIPPKKPINYKPFDFSKLKDSTKPVKKLDKTILLEYRILTDTITNKKDTLLVYNPDY